VVGGNLGIRTRRKIGGWRYGGWICIAGTCMCVGVVVGWLALGWITSVSGASDQDQIEAGR